MIVAEPFTPQRVDMIAVPSWILLYGVKIRNPRISVRMNFS